VFDRRIRVFEIIDQPVNKFRQIAKYAGLRSFGLASRTEHIFTLILRGASWDSPLGVATSSTRIKYLVESGSRYMLGCGDKAHGQ
jgi:hypothetical protein